MGLLPIPAPKLTQGASRAGFWRAAALYDKRLLRGLEEHSLKPTQITLLPSAQ
jgi:hypothetical protein